MQIIKKTLWKPVIFNILLQLMNNYLQVTAINKVYRLIFYRDSEIVHVYLFSQAYKSSCEIGDLKSEVFWADKRALEASLMIGRGQFFARRIVDQSIQPLRDFSTSSQLARRGLTGSKTAFYSSLGDTKYKKFRTAKANRNGYEVFFELNSV